MVHLESSVISATLGAAPTDHARICTDSRALSSWRKCPNVNDLKNVPRVDGANGANGSTAAAEPDRGRCASSMQQPPTSIDAHQRQHLATLWLPETRPWSLTCRDAGRC